MHIYISITTIVFDFCLFVAVTFLYFYIYAHHRIDPFDVEFISPFDKREYHIHEYIEEDDDYREIHVK